MKPYEQGGLDGLCGVYSIINAARIINDFNEDKCQRLFKEVVSHLDQNRNLSRILIDGLNINVIGEVLKNIRSLNVAREMPFRGKSETGLPEFWSSIQEFLRMSNSVVLLAPGGTYDHWSVISSISDNRINFCDSDGIQYINRSNCTTQEPVKGRNHQLLPTHTYFLTQLPIGTTSNWGRTKLTT